MSLETSWSSRLLRKGPLASETYRLFAEWQFDDSVAANLRRGIDGRFDTTGWEKELKSTIGARLRNIERMRSLVQLAKGGMPFEDWRDCYRLWLVASEEPFRTFVLEWLHRERLAGRHQLRAEELRTFVDEVTASAGRPRLSEYGQVRAARDLLRGATELGLLVGRSAAKGFAAAALGDEAFIFHLHLIVELEGSAARVVDSPYWRAAFMEAGDVHATLLRLHQFRRLDYQVAGSLVQLSLPYDSAMACAEAVAA